MDNIELELKLTVSHVALLHSQAKPQVEAAAAPPVEPAAE